MRTALVAGGSGGIGKSCGRAVCDRGHDVVLTARRGPLLKSAAEEIGARYVVADASDPDGSCDALGPLPSIDLEVHAAGVLGGKYACKQAFEQWRITMSANLNSFRRYFGCPAPDYGGWRVPTE